MNIKLVPPLITASTIGEKIVCTRPMREGKFNISLEPFDDKVIVNCYGHGGAGCTTLFGSVNKALQLYQQTNPNPWHPIRVIGSGCMGLTVAIELKRRGYAVAGISTKSLYDIPSWKAGGYFAWVSIKTSPDEQENLIDIGFDTFRTYQKVERGEHPYLSQDAVRYMPLFCSMDTEAGVEDLEIRGLIPPRELVTLDFGNGITHPNFLKYMTYFMDTTFLMRQLTEEVYRLGIALDVRDIRSFEEVSEKVIFNCSGLGAKELNRDEHLIPVRGHLINLNEASGHGHMDYMIYTKVKQEDREEYVYLFPKTSSVSAANPAGIVCRGVIGGTFIPEDDFASEQDEGEFQRLVERNRQFFSGS